ncbi:ComGF family competence protein [Staphylococcus rostri]|nr:ComGF family competence protein [Staphylococcus rostri]
MPSIGRMKMCVLRIYKATRSIVIHSKGFTMIESLFSLYVQLLVVLLIPMLILALIQFRSSFFDDQAYTHELMAKEVGMTLHHPNVSSVSVSENYLGIKQGVNLYTYHVQNLKLVKQVNYRGNITVLNQVKKVSFSKLDKNIRITLIYKEGEQWLEKTFIV